MACRLRPATDDDWYVFTGMLPPAEWYGYVGETDSLILGIGGIYRAGDGRWWISFRRAPGVKNTLMAHRAALRLVALAAEAGIQVHALADDRISGAAFWVRRLGFRETDEAIEGYPVWVLN